MKPRSSRPLRVGLAALSVVAGGAGLAPGASAGPDPVNQPLADGCQRNPAGLLSYTSPEWVFVHGRNAADSVRMVEGAAIYAHTAGEDLPESHSSYDLDFDIVPDPSGAGLLAGDPKANGGHGNGNYADDPQDKGKLHVEWESGSVPSFVWPTQGDRVKLWGQWVWDCGHWGEGITTNPGDPQGSATATGDYFLPGQIKGPPPADLRGEQTELHPMQALIVTRSASWSSPTAATETDAFISNDGTHAYGEARCASGQSSASGVPGPTPLPGGGSYGPDFSACVNNPANQHENISGRSYSFFVPAPPRPAGAGALVLREQKMVAGSGYSEQVNPASDGVHVTVTADMPASDTANHAFGVRYYVGWQAAGGASAGAFPTHLQLTVKTITVNRALAEPNPRHPTVAGLPGIGRYNLYLEANGYWNFMGGKAPEPGDDSWVPQLGMVRDGQAFAVNRSVSLFVPVGAPVRLFVSGRECDLPKIDPCVGTTEVADGNDSPGDTTVGFPSADAAVGDHTLRSPNQDPPYGNPNGAKAPDYEMTYSVRRVIDPGGPGTGVASAPGSTGVASSSAGGDLGGAGSVLAVGGDSGTGGAGSGPPAARCAGGAPPHSRVHRRRHAQHRRIRLRGTARAGACAAVARVQVAVARVVSHRCRFIDRRGRQRRPVPCSRPLFLAARGRGHWRLSLRGHFRRGRYLALSRVTDTLGRVELRRRRGNRARFRIG